MFQISDGFLGYQSISVMSFLIIAAFGAKGVAFRVAFTVAFTVAFATSPSCRTYA